MTDRAREPQSKLRWAEEAPDDPRSDPADPNEPADIPAEPAEPVEPAEPAGMPDAEVTPATSTSGPRLQSKLDTSPFQPSRVDPGSAVPASPAMPPPAEPVGAPGSTGNAELEDDIDPELEDDIDADDEPEADERLSARPTLRDMLRRISPAMAALTVGSVGSALFLLRAMTSHTTPVGVLMSAGVVTALVFALDTVILSAATYRTSKTEEAGWALVFALLGGISAVICALALAGSLIMILVLNS